MPIELIIVPSVPYCSSCIAWIFFLSIEAFVYYSYSRLEKKEPFQH